MHKRSGILLIVFILLLTVIAMPAQAEKEIKIEDSKNISAESITEIMKAADADPTAEIIKIYNVGITFAFAKSTDIDSVFKSGEVLAEYYVVIYPDGSYSFWVKRDGSIRPLELLYHIPHSIQMCQSEDIVNNISDEITVLNRYCLSGESSLNGFAVYYETNEGDYVHYYHHSIGELLFPVEAFCEFQKAQLAEAANHPHSVGTGYYNVWDLSPYDFKADTFNLHAEIPKDNSGDSDATQSNDSGSQQLWLFFGIPIACVLIITLASLHFYRRMKKSNNSL